MTDLYGDLPFDPSYGYDLEGLLAVEPPPEPPEFSDFWTTRYKRAMAADPEPRLTPSERVVPGFVVHDLEYRSADGFPLRGWLLDPADGAAARGVVAAHGYGGEDHADPTQLCPDATYLLPCLRGLGRSAREPISTNPAWHVLHDLHDRDRYIVGGCVEDLWLAVSALLELRPWLAGRVAYLGHSFSGGVGALALAWDDRVSRGHLDVPTFGHQPLRLTLPTIGSGASVQAFARENLYVDETLALYDSAVAARYISQPMHLAVALSDPVVVPPGQFAVYNALPGPKQLFVRRAGHVVHAESVAEDRDLIAELRGFLCLDDDDASPGVPPLAQRPPRS